MTNEEKINRAMAQIMKMAGKSELTEREKNIMQEAIMYANIDMWVEKTINALEFCDKQEFEVRAFSYFMQKTNTKNYKAYNYFKDYEMRERQLIDANRKMI